MRGPELSMALVFAATALLWMTRSIPVGSETNYGWASLIDVWAGGADGLPGGFRAAYIHDATVAIGMAVVLFVIPAGRDDAGERRFLMNWDTARRLPWDVLLLFGGGFSLAAGFEASGLSHWCGNLFESLDLGHPVPLILCVCLLMTFLTEITSNTATTQVMLPILARAGAGMGFNPLLLMLPATISASCAFMLPVATPPNAIVFGSGHVPMGKMVRTGIILNLIGVLLVTAVVYLVARPMLGIAG
jgi:sodium-dependent dicarboxylate transporter 2/3/5